MDDIDDLSQSDDDFDSPTKKKVKIKKQQSSNVCCIHCSNDSGKLYSLLSIEFWQVLLSAAAIRNDTAILAISDPIHTEEDLNAVQYHRQCRSIFTMKAKLDTIEQDRLSTSLEAHCSTQSSQNIVSGTKQLTRRSSDNKWAGVLLPAICIFCDKASKYMSSTRTRKELTKCCELRANSRIKKAAISKNDSRMLTLLSTGLDAIAIEAHYHRSC